MGCSESLAAKQQELSYDLESPDFKRALMQHRFKRAALVIQKGSAVAVGSFNESKREVLKVDPEDGSCALHWAASVQGASDILSLLVDSKNDFGFDINASDKYGNTALHIAVRKNLPDTVTVILACVMTRFGQDDHEDGGDGGPPEGGSMFLLDYLRHKNAKRFPCNKDGHTAVHLAVALNRHKLLPLLLAAGATAHEAFEEGVEEDDEWLKDCGNLVADSIPDQWGRPPIFAGIEVDAVQSVELLVKTFNADSTIPSRPDAAVSEDPGMCQNDPLPRSLDECSATTSVVFRAFEEAPEEAEALPKTKRSSSRVNGWVGAESSDGIQKTAADSFGQIPYQSVEEVPDRFPSTNASARSVRSESKVSLVLPTTDEDTSPEGNSKLLVFGSPRHSIIVGVDDTTKSPTVSGAIVPPSPSNSSQCSGTLGSTATSLNAVVAGLAKSPSTRTLRNAAANRSNTTWADPESPRCPLNTKHHKRYHHPPKGGDLTERKGTGPVYPHHPSHGTSGLEWQTPLEYARKVKAKRCIAFLEKISQEGSASIYQRRGTTISVLTSSKMGNTDRDSPVSRKSLATSATTMSVVAETPDSHLEYSVRSI